MRPSARHPAQLGLRWHVLLVTVISLVPIALFATVLVTRSAFEERARTERVLVGRAQVLASALDREIAASLRALETLARSEHLARGDLAGFRREAVRVDAAQPSWIAIVLYTPAGARLLDTRDAAGGSPVDTRSLAAALRSGAPTVGELVLARDGATWAFALRVPIVHEGAVRHVLTAAISAEEIGRAVAAGAHGDLEWTRTVVDSSGRIVARTRAPERWVGRRESDSFLARTQGVPDDGLFRDRTLEDIESTVGFAHAPLTGWTAAVVAPTDVVDAPVRRLMWLLVAGGVGALTLSVATAFLLARRISRAIESAADAAQALASGGEIAVTPLRIAEVAQLEDALRSSARLLEARREAAERNLADAASAHREAEASSRAKDEFLAMLGHELRNPLSPIVTALHLIRQRATGWSREHEIVTRQVGHLVRLVDDLLDVSRVTRAKVQLRPQPIELCTAVTRAVEMTGPLLEERRHHLEVQVPPGLVVRADPVRLAQIVANLLTNAARYTPPGGHVSIAGAREPDGISLAVTDDGQGIAADLLPHVFDPFVQGERAADRAEGGLGIGLALVRGLVALHGGRVEAASAGPGRGSTFRLVLPASEAPADTPVLLPIPLRRARAGRPLRVLLVDDNADAATLLAEFLERAGVEVEVARDGPAAVEAAAARPPDVAVLDIGLPAMDGYEVAARIRERLGSAAPEFVGLTGYGQARDRERSRAAGFRHHFVKPADPGELLAALEELGPGAERRAPG